VQGDIEYTIVPVRDGAELKSQAKTLNVKLTSPFFPDLRNNQWFTRNIMYLNKENIVNGYLTGEIKPSQLVTRAEAVAMLGSALGYNSEKRETVFKDVSPSSFASGYIQSAYDNGILSGFPDGTFRPDSYVTRAEMSILLSKAYQLSKPSESVHFTDVNSNVTGWEAIEKIAGSSITQGYPDGSFRPYETMTRATYAVFLSRAENPELK
jgi:subtilisin